MLLYAATLVTVIEVLKHYGVDPAVRYGLALLPALPILGIIWAIGCYVAEETDEVRRAKVVQQLLWGSATALSASTLWGFLETLAGAPHLPAYWVFPVFCAGMIASIPLIFWKYR